MTWQQCKHKTVHDHSVMVGDRRRWTCSSCKKQDLWSDAWGYFGTMECAVCWCADIEYVACSDDCMKVLVSKHGLVDELKSKKAPKAKTATPKPKRMTAWERKAMAAGWKPPS